MPDVGIYNTSFEGLDRKPLHLSHLVPLKTETPRGAPLYEVVRGYTYNLEVPHAWYNHLTLQYDGPMEYPFVHSVVNARGGEKHLDDHTDAASYRGRLRKLELRFKPFHTPDVVVSYYSLHVTGSTSFPFELDTRIFFRLKWRG